MNEGWINTRLIDVAEIIVSNVDKKIYDDELPIRLCNYMDVYRNRYISNEISFSRGSVTRIEYDKFSLEKGDVIITKDSETPDDIAVPTVLIEDIKDLICGYHLAILKPKESILDGVFLMNLLQTQIIKQQFSAGANGVTRYGLVRDAIFNIKLKIPPYQTQQKIAKILSKIDEVISDTEELIEKYKAIKSGLLEDLFSRGIDENGKLRPSPQDAPDLYKDSVLGLIPKDWEVVNFDKATNLIIDGTHFTPTYLEQGVPFLRVTDIHNTTLNPDKFKYISQEEHELLTKRCKPEKGDILYSKNGTIGVPKLVDWGFEFSVFVSLALIKPKHELINNFFLLNLLKHDIIWKQIKRSAKQGTVTNLHLEEIRKFDIPIPTMEEQIKISENIKTLDFSLNTEQEYLTKLQGIRWGLLEDLLSGRVLV